MLFRSELPFNGKKAYDVLIRNIRIVHTNGKKTVSDIAVSYQVDTHTEDTPVLGNLGDLHTYVGMREIDGNGCEIPQALLILDQPFNWRQFVKE